MWQVNLSEQRIGQINKNTYGSIMEIIEYNKVGDIWVKFSKGNPVHTNWGAFCKGKVRNVYDRSVCGIGYIGEGTYKVSENGKHTVQYGVWRDMLKRCYNNKTQENNPTYIDCVVAEEWHNFQVFAKWFDNNYYIIKGEKMSLDKDILIKGNKIYSQNTCIFLPQNINNLFTKSDVKRGELPIGVYWRERDKKYVAQCSSGKGKKDHIGYFNTPEEAFNAYKKFKENLIKEVANKYKDKIPNNLYEAMLNYIVEIDD